MLNIKRLTDWKKEPDLRQLKADFDASKPYHDEQVKKVQKWNNLREVKGSAAAKKVNGRSSVQPKLIRKQAEWRYPALSEPFLSNDKIFEVKPKTFEDANAAKQNSMVLNWQFRSKINRVKFIDDYVRTTVDEGTCVVRLGWERQTVMVTETVPVYSYFPIQTNEELQTLQQAVEAQETDPRGFEETAAPEIKAAVEYYLETQQPVYAEQTGTQDTKVEKVLQNRPVLTVLHMDNFYVDPSCQGDLDKAMFAVVSFETSQAELRKSPGAYKNLEAVDWQNATPATNPDHATATPTDFSLNDPLRKRIIAHEYWGFWDIDGSGELKPIVATWIGDILIRLELNPFPDNKLPFVLVPYLPIKRELFGETDAELLEDNQAILGAVTRGMIDLMGRSANSQKGFAKGMLDPLNKRRYESGQDYEFNPQLNPQANLIEHQYPEIPVSALTMVQMQHQDAEALTGVKSFSGGISGEALGDVAAAVRGALDAASKREMSILRRLAEGLVKIGVKLVAMNAVFLSEKEVVRITNEKFVTINRDDLVGEFDLEVDISTAEIEEAKARDLAFILQTLGPNSPPELVFLILTEICELKRMPELAEKPRNFKPTPSPAQQKLEELAILKAQLEVEELQSKIALNRAKADHEKAKADQADLDFVEQETGTKHARELQKQQGQSRGNQDLEITKALLKPLKPEESEPDINAAVGYGQLSGATV